MRSTYPAETLPDSLRRPNRDLQPEQRSVVFRSTWGQCPAEPHSQATKHRTGRSSLDTRNRSVREQLLEDIKGTRCIAALRNGSRAEGSPPRLWDGFALPIAGNGIHIRSDLTGSSTERAVCRGYLPSRVEYKG